MLMCIASFLMQYTAQSITLSLCFKSTCYRYIYFVPHGKGRTAGGTDEGFHLQTQRTATGNTLKTRSRSNIDQQMIYRETSRYLKLMAQRVSIHPNIHMYLIHRQPARKRAFFWSGLPLLPPSDSACLPVPGMPDKAKVQVFH